MSWRLVAKITKIFVSTRDNGGGMVDVGYTWVGKWSRCWVASAVFNWRHCPEVKVG